MDDVAIWAEFSNIQFCGYRISVGSSTQDIIGTCLICGNPFDDYSSRCRCKYCRMLVLVCDNCQVCYNSNLFVLILIWLAVPLFSDFLVTTWILKFVFPFLLLYHFFKSLYLSCDLWYPASASCYCGSEKGDPICLWTMSEAWQGGWGDFTIPELKIQSSLATKWTWNWFPATSVE